MKISILECPSWKTIIRIDPFIKFLNKNGHKIFYTENIVDCLDSDLILIEYYYYDFTKIKNELMSFKGKVVFYSCDDISNYSTHFLDDDLISKIEAWITFEIHDQNENNIRLKDKLILFPRFNWNKIPDYCDSNQKENKIFLWVSSTGYFNFENKNLRVELFKKLIQDDYLNQFIVGGIAQSDIIDLGKNQNHKYNSTFQKYVKPYVGYDQYIEEMRKYRICLCPPGNSKWGPRHIDAMSSKSIIISVDPRNDPGFWDKQEEVYKNIVIVKDDLSDIIEICKEVLNNTLKYQDKIDDSYVLYKEYFKLSKHGFYNNKINSDLLLQFKKRNIDL